METNTKIINVISKDFSFVKDTLESSNVNNIENSLNSIIVTLKKYSTSIEDMKANLTNGDTNTIFIPYLKPSQFFNELKDLSEGIIVISGIDTETADFTQLKNNAWIMYEKIVVGERHGEMVKNHTDIYVDMFKVAFPRNSSCKRNQERITTRPEERYEKFVELLNQGLTMKEIAVALGLSVPATYLIRAQNKDRLLADSNVNKKAPAMRFNCKRI